jgi:hypothetical protein
LKLQASTTDVLRNVMALTQLGEPMRLNGWQRIGARRRDLLRMLIAALAALVAATSFADRVLINAQIAAGYALTLRLRHLWYWYFCLRLSKK